MKTLIMTCLTLQVLTLSAQSSDLNMTNNALIHIGDAAQLFIGGNADLSGKIENEGVINLAGGVDFHENKEVGNLKFSGTAEQVVSGQEIIVKDLTLEKENEVRLVLDSMEVTGVLELINGRINTLESKVTVSTGDIAGGSESSYISGKLYRKSNGEGLAFPMGINGFFNGVELSPLPASSTVAVELRQLENGLTVSGDSLVGLAKEAEWVISYSGVDTEVKVNINFNGLDLLSASNDNPIRAFSYTPVIATIPEGDDQYRPLGVEGLSDTDSLTFGTIGHLKPIHLTDGFVSALSIGRMPISTGFFFYMPNAFSPNAAEPENQVFRPFLDGLEIKSVRMHVWDSFNREVYRLVEENPVLEEIGWNGIHSGNIAEQGIYFYSINLVTDSGTFEKSGSLFLVL